MGYVYLITNLLNGKMYIGKHLGQPTDAYMGSGVLLKRAIAKYSISNFSKTILCECDSLSELNNQEKHFIAEYRSRFPNQIYNIANGGEGGDTFTHQSDDRKIEILQKISDKSHTEENNLSRSKKIKDALTGRTKSPETRTRISQANKGQQWSAERRQAFSSTKKELHGKGDLVMPKGNAGNKAFKHTEESKRAISESIAQLYIQKMDNGEPWRSPEAIERMTDRIKEFWSEEQRQLQSQRIKDSWKDRKRKSEKKIWIHNPDLKNRTQILESEPIPDGWFRGMGTY